MGRDWLRDGLLIVMIAAVGVLSWRVYFQKYRARDTVDIHRFPHKIGRWTGYDLVISDDEYAILETRNAFARKYVDGRGAVVYVLMVYSQNNRKVSHPPEICYVGSGASVVASEPESIEVPQLGLRVPAVKLVLEYNDQRQISYYWFKVGRRYTNNYWVQQFWIAAHSLLNQPASSALIRLAVPAFNQNEDTSASSVLEEFARMIIPLLPQYLP